MSTTTDTQAHATITLTCNHSGVVTIPADGEVRVGDKVACTKCPARKSDGQAPTRRIKAMASYAAPAPAWKPEPEDTGMVHGPEAPMYPAPSGHTAQATKVARYEAAKAEWAALKAWKQAGSVGDRPATPTLDAQNGENAGGKGARPASKARAPRAPRQPRAAMPAGLRFHRNGRPLASSRGSQFACLAYFYTKGVDGNRPRITTGELRAILTAAGITDPTTTEWEHTLPNGVTLSARIITD